MLSDGLKRQVYIQPGDARGLPNQDFRVPGLGLEALRVLVFRPEGS